MRLFSLLLAAFVASSASQTAFSRGNHPQWGSAIHGPAPMLPASSSKNVGISEKNLNGHVNDIVFGADGVIFLVSHSRVWPCLQAACSGLQGRGGW